jgi:hypothetical protein
MSYDEHQAMWPQMIAALAAIDAELGIPDDGCNSLAQTLAAIRALKASAEIANQPLAQPLTRNQIDAVMTEHYPLESLMKEGVDAFEACVRDIERRHGIGA